MIKISWMTLSRWRIILYVRQRNSLNMRSRCRSWGMLFITFMFCKGKLTPMLSMIFFYYPKKKDAMCNLALNMDQSRSLYYTFEYHLALNSNLNFFFFHFKTSDENQQSKQGLVQKIWNHTLLSRLCMHKKSKSAQKIQMMI